MAFPSVSSEVPSQLPARACINGADFLLTWFYSSPTSSKAQKMLFKDLIFAALAGGAVVLGQNVTDAKVISTNSSMDYSSDTKDSLPNCKRRRWTQRAK